MIEKLAQRGRAASSARLFSIDRVQCLIHKLSEDAEEVDPLRHSHCETQIVVHVSECSNDVNDQSSQCDQVWCDALKIINDKLRFSFL